MKRLVALGIAVLLGVSARGQGTVNFNGGPVYVGSIGGPLASPANGPWLATLYAGPVGSVPNSMVGISGAPVQVGVPTPGMINGGAVPITGIPSGTAATLQIRAWHQSLGATWESVPGVQLDGSTAGTGLSPVVTVTLGGGPNPVPNLTGLFPMVVSPIPEPSAIALGLLGLCAFALVRRRT